MKNSIVKSGRTAAFMALIAGVCGAGEMKTADYEAFVKAVGDMPPVLKLDSLEAYS